MYTKPLSSTSMHLTNVRSNYSFKYDQKKSKSKSSNNTNLGANPCSESKSKIVLQIISGLMNLLKNHTADLPNPSTDWKLIFGLLEVCGAGRRAKPNLDSSKSSVSSSRNKYRTDKMICTFELGFFSNHNFSFLLFF